MSSNNTTPADTPKSEIESIFSETETCVDSDTDIDDTPPDALSQDLIDAIDSTKPSNVKLRLKAGDLIFARGINNCNALHYAVKAGGRRVLLELLKSKELRNNSKAINRPDGDGENPLHLAIRLGRLELASELLNAKADVNALDNYGRTILEKALKGNKDDIVELLLKHDADEKLLGNHSDPTVRRRLVQIKQIIRSRSQ
jgi:ankyrin repeat protein